jgi:hypothetical protein
MSDLYEEKLPTTNDKYVGIEIECFTRKREFIDEEFDELNPNIERVFKKYGLQKYVEISDDGSIDAPTIEIENEFYDEDDPFSSTTTEISAATMELKVLAKQNELAPVLEKLGKALKEIGAEVNESCGLHVHLDMRNRPVLDCIKKLLNVQGIMLKSVPSHRRNNTYCLPVSKKYEKNLTEIGKYHVINTTTLEDLKTIEVRVHEGTVDVKEIQNWCSFLIKTIDQDFATKNLRTSKHFPVRLRNYIERRMAASR